MVGRETSSSRCRIDRRRDRCRPGRVGRTARTHPRGTGGPSGRDVRSGPAVRCLLRRSDDQRDHVPDAIAARARVSRHSSPAASQASTWRWPTTASATRPTRSISCCARTSSAPISRRPRRGTGTVDVGDFVQFSDPNDVIGFPIQRSDRLLTGADVDPESLQRGKHGDLWMGDEFGPWILHFDETGRAARTAVPGPGRASSARRASPVSWSRPPAHFFSPAAAATVAGSRGFESMSATPDGKYLYGLLEGATVQDSNLDRRYLVEFSIADRAFTGKGLAVPHAADGDRHPAVLLHGRHVGARPASDGRDRAGQRPGRSRATVRGDLLARGLRDRPARRRSGRLPREDPGDRPHRDRRPRPRLAAGDPCG